MTRDLVRERWQAAVAVGVVIVATAWLFSPLVVGALIGEPRFFEWDVPEQYWPDLVYLCRSLHSGELPYWNPYDRAGYPYYADPQATIYHPLAWGICAVAGPAPGLGWQEARVVIGFLCAGIFGLLWLRRLGASWAAASLGAVLLQAAPFMRHNWELNLTSAIGFFPMVLWALERTLVERRLRDAALLALAEALLVWTGSPPAAWLAGSFTALYAAWRLVELGRGEGRAALARAGLLLALAAVLVIGLCAVVLAPGLTLSRYSVQAGRSYESIAEGALPLEELRALVWPRDGNHLYVGWIALALAPLAFWRKERLPGRAVLAVGALIAVLLALGDHGPLFGAAFDVVPGVRMFRLPHRYEVWLGPCVAALAAGGLDALRERLGERTPPAAAMVAGVSFVLGVAWLVFAPGLAPVALALGTATVIAAALARRPAAWSMAAGVLALLTLLDVSQRMPEDRHTRPRPAPGGEDVVARVLPLAPGTDIAWRYMDEFGISCRSGTRLGRRDLRGYQDPLLLAAYERVLAALREHPELAMQFNVRYALTGPHFIHGWDRHYLPPPAELRALPGAIDRGEGVIEFERALPLAYFVPEASIERVVLREDALERTIAQAPAPIAILEGDREVAPSAPVVADREGASSERAPEVIALRVASYESDSLALVVDAATPGAVVINEAWYPGWVARVSGAEAPIVRANGLVRAVEVPAGRHRVELRFEPPDGAPLRWILAGSWLLVLALLVPWPPRRRMRDAPDPPE